MSTIAQKIKFASTKSANIGHDASNDKSRLIECWMMIEMLMLMFIFFLKIAVNQSIEVNRLFLLLY